MLHHSLLTIHVELPPIIYMTSRVHAHVDAFSVTQSGCSHLLQEYHSHWLNHACSQTPIRSSVQKFADSKEF